MAGLVIEMNGSFKEFRTFVRSFPRLRIHYLSSIGKQGRLLMKTSLLSGQAINLKQWPKDSRGRYTITSRVIRRGNALMFSSYPANLFEKGRKWANRKEPGKKIIRGRFKSLLGARISGFSKRSFGRTIGKAMEKV